ncbi:hypothetical protein PoB_005969000 [Plakobranchus ocellatus]|uniref:Uncharacterized protein n=1 Tax=Plakobranchus ocellatus TaxID=259542 RepID=A0AAV4CM81_9GAST|nr:hypothetical protein PoB_005969000 [Plakobranchus ocellatus]
MEKSRPYDTAREAYLQLNLGVTRPSPLAPTKIHLSDLRNLTVEQEGPTALDCSKTAFVTCYRKLRIPTTDDSPLNRGSCRYTFSRQHCKQKTEK